MRTKVAVFAILIVILISLSVYYYNTVYIPAQEQSAQIRDIVND